MKVVLDTNVYLSTFLFKGTAARAFERCVINHEIYISRWMLDEIQEKLRDKFHLSLEETQEVLTTILTPAQLVQPTNPLPDICRDKDDNNVLQLSEFVSAQYLITGDKDLLVLQKHKSAVIVNPSDFLKLPE